MAYPESKRLEILRYAKEHGVNEAAKKFNIYRNGIMKWNRIYNIYTAVSYTKEQKLEILEYVKKHGVMNAAKKFKTDKTTIARWNKKYNIYKFQKERRKFSKAEKLEVLNYAKKHGINKAAKKFDMCSSNVIQWNRKYKIFEVEYFYTEKEKLEILEYAREHGLNKASKKFNIYKNTIIRWNMATDGEFWEPRKAGAANDEDFIMEALKYAAEHSPAAAARKYNITSSHIVVWNRIRKVYNPKGIKSNKCDFSIDEKEKMLEEALEKGYYRTSQKYDICPSTLSLYNFDTSEPIVPSKHISDEANKAIMDEVGEKLSDTRKWQIQKAINDTRGRVKR